MYNTIYELPSQVRASLDEHDQGVFLETYNSLEPSTKDEVKDAMIKAWEACKDLPSSFSFCITASVETIDRQKEMIGIKSIMDHMDSFLEYGGNIQDEHGDYHVATIWKWEPTEIQGLPAVNVWGNVFGGDMVYDKVRQDFVNGKNSLSIAGEADMGKYQCDEKGCYVKRNVEQLMEISLCSVPCNPLATLVWYNTGAKLTKSFDSNINLRVEQYTIHKDAQFCPIQAVKKALLSAGIEAHAKEYGVEVDAKYEPRIAKSKTLGYVRKGDKLIVQARGRMFDKSRANCLKKGYITPTGVVKDTMPANVLASLKKNNFVTMENGAYLFRNKPIYKSKATAKEVAAEWFAEVLSEITLFGKTADFTADDVKVGRVAEYREDEDTVYAEVELCWDCKCGDADLHIRAELEVDSEEDGTGEVWESQYYLVVDGKEHGPHSCLCDDVLADLEDLLRETYGDGIADRFTLE